MLTSDGDKKHSVDGDAVTWTGRRREGIKPQDCASSQSSEDEETDADGNGVTVQTVACVCVCVCVLYLPLSPLPQAPPLIVPNTCKQYHKVCAWDILSLIHVQEKERV